MWYVKTHQEGRRQYSQVWEFFVVANRKGYIEVKLLDKHLFYFLQH